MLVITAVMQYICSKLGANKNRNDLERVQKSAVKLILGARYESYNDALKILGLETLDKRRDKMCLKYFAKQCSQIMKVIT